MRSLKGGYRGSIGGIYIYKYGCYVGIIENTMENENNEPPLMENELDSENLLEN